MRAIKHEINYKERVAMVKAMELIARSVNDEEVFMPWLMLGIADGDIEDPTSNADDEYIADNYCDDETYAELMNTFLTIMRKASKNGGLYSDYICSEPEPKKTKTSSGYSDIIHMEPPEEHIQETMTIDDLTDEEIEEGCKAACTTSNLKESYRRTVSRGKTLNENELFVDFE